MFKKQNGITLVALVITIIVLLILAGVTISMVVGDNGILTRSKQARFETAAAEIDEKVDLAMADLTADFQVKLANNSGATYTGKDVVEVLKKTLGDNIADTDADGTYKVTFGSTVITSSTTDTVIPNTGTASITIDYTDTTLKNSATSGWTAAKLSYTITLSNWEVTAITDAADNDGGY